MGNKNEQIKLWILEQDRETNREKALKDLNERAKYRYAEQKNVCPNCKNAYDDPKLVQYFACPHCSSKVEVGQVGCQHFFGFLGQREKGESVPQECTECEKVVECMLNQYHNSSNALNEIKKWY
jgi:DNA-directed RNA polymerase subunit RPC12/RpoP